MLKRLTFAAATALSLTGVALFPASADDAATKAKAQSYTETEIKKWTADPDIVAALTAANAEHASLDQAKIDELDKQWRAEVGAAAHPLVDAVLGSAASTKLKAICAEKAGLVTEMILMDNKGLNVGVCDATSDYWQGDEGKWQKTFQAGPNAIFVDDIEQDESSQKFQLQTSITVVDAGGQPIGALTVGLDAEALTAQ